ncbi:MAG: transcription antitermination factor NusB [Breznakia sp.]
MNRHETREVAMSVLYQSLLLDKDIKRVLIENNDVGNDISPFLYTLTIDAFHNKLAYIDNINKHLKKDWSFDRLGYIEQAIFIVACAELDFETAQRSVVINEAIALAKKYCDEDVYRLVNGVLDKL